MLVLDDDSPLMLRLRKLLKWLLANAAWVCLCCIALSFVIGSGALFLIFEPGMRVWFEEDSEDAKELERFEQRFSGSDNLFFVVHHRDGTLFEPRLMAAIEELTAGAWQIPYAVRVDSVTNFQHVRADGDEVIVADLVSKPNKLSKKEMQKVQEIAVSEPLLINRLISPDAKTAGVNVLVHKSDESKSLADVGRAARALKERIETRYPYLYVGLTGGMMLDIAFAETARRDSVTLVPLMYVILGVLTYLILGDLLAAGLVLGEIFFVVFITLGVVGWSGFHLNNASALSPILVLTVAVANAIHFFSKLFLYLRNKQDIDQAIISAFRVNVGPLTVANFTTTIGFLALNAAGSPPIREFGNLTAVGILACWLLTIFFLPCLIRWIHSHYPIEAPKRGFISRFVRVWTLCLPAVLVRRRLAFSILGIVLAAGATVSALKIRADENFNQYFDKSIPIRQASDFILENLTGVFPFEYTLDAGKAGGVNDPEFLLEVDAFTQWLLSHEKVTSAASYLQVAKKLNKALHGDDPREYRVPDTAEAIAQQQLLYELSLPYGQDLTDRISIDKRSLRLTIYVGDMTVAELRELFSKIDIWLKENTTTFEATPTGDGYVWTYLTRRVIKNMFLGDVYALLLITALTAVFMGSFAVGLFSIIPNGLPLLLTLGVWGLASGVIGMGGSLFFALALGIIVDDTVYFLYRYLHVRRIWGFSPKRAIYHTFRIVGEPMVYTTAILSLSFLVLAQSHFSVNRELGLIVSLAIALALLFDFLFLPAALLAVDRSRQDDR